MSESTTSRRRFLASAAGAAGMVVAGAPTVVWSGEAALGSPPAGKRLRVATVVHGRNAKSTIEQNREFVMGLLDEAVKNRPDLVVLPETFTTVGGADGLPMEQKAESIPGPTVEAAAKRARENRCYVVCPILTKQRGSVFNSAIIIDRSGQVCGVYNKYCPVTTSADYTSMEGGVRPGSEIPVFDLDFGRIGIQICFDAGFPENWQELARQGARMVLWPSAYDGGCSLWTYAYLHHFWVVSAVRSGQSRVIDPLGAVLLETEAERPVIYRDINLDFATYHLDWNYGIEEKIKQAYGDRVDVRRPEAGCSHLIVEPLDPSITTRQLQEQFGFETTQQYFNRHREAYKQLREGKAAAPQQALHGKRAQYGK
jgi:predicted amidohydrolase